MIEPYYDHGGITLYHGDSRTLIPKLGTFGVVITAPPTAPAGGIVVPDNELLVLIMTAAPEEFYWLQTVQQLPTGFLQTNRLLHIIGDRHEIVSEGDIADAEDSVAPENAWQLPMHLARWSVKRSQGRILDPFAGGGTTLVAARDLGRRAVGIEIQEDRCDMAVRRLEQ